MKKRTKAKKLSPIEKMLKDHKPFCKMNEYSLLEERNCTCGRDAAQDTWFEVKAFLIKMDEWLEKNDSLASNSPAHVELDLILEKLK